MTARERRLMPAGPAMVPFDAAYIRERSEANETGCWEWTGFVNSAGYGRSGNSTGSRQAHRLSYEIFKGAISGDLQIDHLCRNRRCVNPDHLEPVTPRENVLRGETIPAEHASRSHCIHGHPFDEKNTRVNGDGERACRACDAQRARVRRRER